MSDKLNKLLTRKQELEGEISTFKAELQKAIGSHRASDLSKQVLIFETELEATLQSIEQEEKAAQGKKEFEGSKEYQGWIKEKNNLEESCRKRTEKLAEELKSITAEAGAILEQVKQVDRLDRKTGRNLSGWSKRMSQPYAWLGLVQAYLDRRVKDWEFLGGR